MPNRAIQLVLQYDGTEFAGWQRQPGKRTVQGVLEDALSRLTNAPATVVGAGRTDAGVHARGQAAGVSVADKWNAEELRRALNAIVPADIWIAAAHEMQTEFHARRSATARRYAYRVGVDDAARSPFRRRWEYGLRAPIDPAALRATAQLFLGRLCFVAFAVRGTAPPTDDHKCTVTHAEWRAVQGGFVFEIEANRFLHHMVRFVVGTSLDVATGKRPIGDIAALLASAVNDDVSPPAPPHALYLERVTYPDHLYLRAA